LLPKLLPKAAPKFQSKLRVSFANNPSTVPKSPLRCRNIPPKPQPTLPKPELTAFDSFEFDAGTGQSAGSATTDDNNY